MDAADFYDHFLSTQVKSGINDRIYHLYRRVRKIGLQRNEAILEVGCGIGALTFLLAKRISKGMIEAFDPSTKSIRFAKEKIRRPNVQFYTGDITTYLPRTSGSFDKILLFDVLEHIPEEEHAQVFNKIESLLKKDGLLLINLPNPAYILYDRVHQPDVLQEVDQPVFLEKLLPVLTKANFELLLF
jgi:trans-aconitate 2-methyltransferase